MKKEITVTAKTTAEAIEKAVAELGAPSADAIEYTVLEEAKKGLFGIGAAPAKIKASYTLKGVYVALEMIKKVVADMGIEATVTYTKTADGDDRINIDGEGAGILIGHHSADNGRHLILGCPDLTAEGFCLNGQVHHSHRRRRVHSVSHKLYALCDDLILCRLVVGYVQRKQRLSKNGNEHAKSNSDNNNHNE